MMSITTDERNQQNESIPSWISNADRSPRKSSWQIARDLTTEFLARKSTKLGVKQTTIPNLTRQISVVKKPTVPGTTTMSKPSQPYRIPRMPTEKEAALIDISYGFSCSFCDGLCIDENVRCRICTKTCHSRCLSQRGRVSHLSVPLGRFVKQNWSCADCSDLTRLLRHDELLYLIHAFDQIDRNKDGYIILDEFLSLQSDKTVSDGLELFVQYNKDIGKKYFNLMDSAQTGVVAWSDFIVLYCCKLIVAKDKMELTTKLTEKELVMIRNLFLKDPRKSFDNDYHRIITREYFNRVHQDLHSLLNEKYGIDFMDAILGYDHSPENISKKSPTMNWAEFLCEISLFILLNRSNGKMAYSQARRASIPTHLLYLSKVPRPMLPMREDNLSRRSSIASSDTLITSQVFPETSCDEIFCQHAKVLAKLKQRNRTEELKRKQMGSSLNFTIVENQNEKEDMKLPKLKLYARDDRKAIIDPWTSVNEMQRLRKEPVLVQKTRVKMYNS